MQFRIQGKQCLICYVEALQWQSGFLLVSSHAFDKSWYIVWMQACAFGKNMDLSLAAIFFPPVSYFQGLKMKVKITIY